MNTWDLDKKLDKAPGSHPGAPNGDKYIYILLGDDGFYGNMLGAFHVDAVDVVLCKFNESLVGTYP